MAAAEARTATAEADERVHAAEARAAEAEAVATRTAAAKAYALLNVISEHPKVPQRLREGAIRCLDQRTPRPPSAAHFRPNSQPNSDGFSAAARPRSFAPRPSMNVSSTLICASASACAFSEVSCCCPMRTECTTAFSSAAKLKPEQMVFTSRHSFLMSSMP